MKIFMANFDGDILFYDFGSKRYIIENTGGFYLNSFTIEKEKACWVATTDDEKFDVDNTCTIEQITDRVLLNHLEKIRAKNIT